MHDESIAELILGSEAASQRRFRLGPEPCGVGRSAQNTVVLPSEMVSRNHAMIQKNESGGYSVFDLGSRNGTFLNSRRLVAPASLRNGDVLSIGSFVLVFSDAASPVLEQQPAPDFDPAQTRVHLRTLKITVMVIDIRDFTGLARGLGESRIAEVIGSFNHETGAIFENAGAWAVKFIGDAVMAVWDHRDEPPLACLRTAIRTAVAVQNLAARFQTQYDLPRPLLIGIGINTGLASIGNLGSGITSDYTALGDVVNKAFRLESSTRVLDADLAFGDEVRATLAGLPVENVLRAAQVQLKGYAEGCTVYAMRASAVPQLIPLIEGALSASVQPAAAMPGQPD